MMVEGPEEASSGRILHPREEVERLPKAREEEGATVAEGGEEASKCLMG
jgi:hypothetical protein